MKKIFVLLLITLCTNVFAQRIIHVDTEYIMGKIPAYEQAQKNLNNLSEQWQKEIDSKRSEIEEMYKKYQNEKVLMSEEMKRKKEDEIIAKEKDVKELQKKYFGKDGQLYTKRQELIKPIQDEVYNAIKEIAVEGNYDYVIDKSTGAILYANDKYEKSDDVLKKLGY